VYLLAKVADVDTTLQFTSDSVIVETPGRGQFKFPNGRITLYKIRAGLVGTVDRTIVFLLPYRVLAPDQLMAIEQSYRVRS